MAHPTRYLARLAVDPAQETFSGELSISLVIDEPTDVFWLNATELSLSKVTLAQAGSSLALEVLPGGEDFVGLRGSAPFTPGEAEVTIAYTGKLDRERSRGLYSQEENGAWYAYTFFEPIDARRVFPCFDEPSYKVPWKLELTVPQGAGAFANTREEGQIPLGDRVVHRFAETPPLPSYLVAFGVGPFEVLDAGTGGAAKVPVRIVLPKGRAAEAKYALSVSGRIVTELEQFIGIPFPMEKLDVLVVPRFWGTMEHPGLVAMGQPLTLIKAEEDNAQRRQGYANILIHELGHYWFGDLVTAAWWDDIWLNEAITTWFDTRVTDRFEPSWSWRAEHEAEMRGAAFRTDGLLSAQSLRAPVASRDDITGSFENTITYFKGYAVLTMIESWVGPEKFRAILRDYLNAHAWKNARTEDLLQAFEDGAGREVRDAFESFIVQPGTPLVTATVACDKGQPPRLSLTQERFVQGGKAPAQEWTVPVCLRSDLGVSCTVLDAPQKETQLPWKKCPAWVMPNADGRGYYRSRYSDEEATRLLLKTKLTDQERLAVAMDVAALAQRGELSAAKAMALVPPLAKDPSRLMLMTALSLTGSVRTDLLQGEDRQRLAAFVRRTFGDAAKKLGWTPAKGEKPDVAQTRAMVLSMVGGAGEDPAIRAEARRRLEAYLADRSTLDPQLSWVVLGLGAVDGDAALFERILAEVKKTTDPREKGRLYLALASFRDPKLNRRAMELALSKDVDLRDANVLLYRPLQDRDTRDAAWTFLEENFDQIASRMREDELSWLAGMVGGICEEARLQKADQVFREKGPKYGLAMRALDNATERARQCIASSKVTLPEVRAFLGGTAGR